MQNWGKDIDFDGYITGLTQGFPWFELGMELVVSLDTKISVAELIKETIEEAIGPNWDRRINFVR